MSAADKKSASLAERAKFQLEADSEDDEMENEIDANLDALGGAAARLNGLARATGKEVDEQNRHLERINAKSSRVDDEVCGYSLLAGFIWRFWRLLGWGFGHWERDDWLTGVIAL